MKIKRIEICGFKSFVDKTTISFPGSDHVDRRTQRLRQVERRRLDPLGHGRAVGQAPARPRHGGRDLRRLGEPRPAGMAEVSLTFDSSGLDQDVAPGGVPWGAAAPEEIVVTRRLYRDGNSEYLLNGVPSRLRDVVEFFLGTGVGSKAYAIIEQGRIGFIVSSRPEDRRGLIDEAAGITKLQGEEEGGGAPDGLDAPAPAARLRHHQRDRGAVAVAAAAGAEGGALQALQERAQGSRSMVGGAALPRTPGGGEVAGRRAGERARRVIRPRAPRWRRERPPPTPIAWP